MEGVLFQDVSGMNHQKETKSTLIQYLTTPHPTLPPLPLPSTPFFFFKKCLLCEIVSKQISGPPTKALSKIVA